MIAGLGRILTCREGHERQQLIVGLSGVEVVEIGACPAATTAEARLASGEVAVHRVALGVGGADLASLEAVLSRDERERAGRFRFGRHRDRFIVARSALRRILSVYGAGAPAEIRLRYGPKGKPRLASDCGIEFNVSHSEDLAVVAVAQGSEVGIDVERIRAMPSGRAIARRFFSATEAAMLERLPAAEFGEAFWRCWTRKEAYVKARGDGLSLPLDSFDVSLEAPGRLLLLATRPDAGEAHHWRLLDVNVGPGYAAALAVGGPVDRLRCVGFPGPPHGGPPCASRRPSAQAPRSARTGASSSSSRRTGVVSAGCLPLTRA